MLAEHEALGRVAERVDDRSAQAPRRSMSRTIASQRGRDLVVPREQPGDVVAVRSGRSAPVDRGDPDLLGQHEVLQQLRDRLAPAFPETVTWRGGSRSSRSSLVRELLGRVEQRPGVVDVVVDQLRRCSAVHGAAAVGLSTHSESAGGSGSRWARSASGRGAAAPVPLGGWPKARAKARLKPSTDS